MRIKNKFSVSDKVEIVADNKYFFQEIACLVDSPKFIQEARLIKARLGILEPIIDTDKHFVDLFGHWEKIYIDWRTKNESNTKILEAWTGRTLRKLDCSSHLRDVVIQAILFNMVVSYSGIIKILSKESKFTEPTIAIIPTPHTTYDEIKEALREAKNLMKTLSSRYKTENLKDTTPNIKQYRDWYWKHAFGMTYQQIADEWEKQKKVSIGYEDVAEAINTYQKMLL